MSAQRGEAEAIMFVPPARSGTTATAANGNGKQAPLNYTVTGTSTAAAATGASTTSASGGVVCFTFSSDVAFHMCFGNSAVGAATTNDMYYPAGFYSVICRPGIETHFRVIKASGAADGIGRAYASSP